MCELPLPRNETAQRFASSGSLLLPLLLGDRVPEQASGLISTLVILALIHQPQPHICRLHRLLCRSLVRSINHRYHATANQGRKCHSRGRTSQHWELDRPILDHTYFTRGSYEIPHPTTAPAITALR